MRRIAVGLIALLLLAGCAGKPTRSMRLAEPTTTVPATVTAEPSFPFAESVQGAVTYVEYKPGSQMAVLPSEAEEPVPCVVVVHGYNVEPTFYFDLAKALTRKDLAVFVPEWDDTLPSEADPRTETVTAGLDDLADALRFVRQNAERYGGDPDRVVIVGHSLGAAVSLDLMLAGDRFGSEAFPKSTSAVPDAYVSLDGAVPFREQLWDEGLRRLYAQDPETWEKLNADTYLKGAAAPEETDFRFFVAVFDAGETEALARRLDKAGYDTRVDTIAVDHMGAAEPQEATVKAIARLAHAKD